MRASPSSNRMDSSPFLWHPGHPPLLTSDTAPQLSCPLEVLSFSILSYVISWLQFPSIPTSPSPDPLLPPLRREQVSQEHQSNMVKQATITPGTHHCIKAGQSPVGGKGPHKQAKEGGEERKEEGEERKRKTVICESEFSLIRLSFAGRLISYEGQHCCPWREQIK